MVAAEIGDDDIKAQAAYDAAFSVLASTMPLNLDEATGRLRFLAYVGRELIGDASTQRDIHAAMLQVAAWLAMTATARDYPSTPNGSREHLLSKCARFTARRLYAAMRTIASGGGAADVAEFNVAQAVTVAGIALASSWLLAYVNHRLALRRDRLLKADERKRSGNYVAIRVVCILDEFVDRCVETSNDEGSPDQEGIYEPRTSIPELALPSDLDWKTIDHSLMYISLAIPNKISAARESISFIATDIAGPPDYEEVFDERMIRFAEIGLEALMLAEKLRATHGIPARELPEHYQPKEALEEILTKRRAFVAAKDEARRADVERMGLFRQPTKTP